MAFHSIRLNRFSVKEPINDKLKQSKKKIGMPDFTCSIRILLLINEQTH